MRRPPSDDLGPLLPSLDAFEVVEAPETDREEREKNIGTAPKTIVSLKTVLG